MRAFLLAGVSALLISSTASAQVIGNNSHQDVTTVAPVIAPTNIVAPVIAPVLAPVAAGGSVLASGNSAVVGSGNSSVDNANLQGQLQGQQQGQGQDQGQTQSSSSTSSAVTGASTSSVSGVTAKSEAANNEQAVDVTVAGDAAQDRNPVSTAFSMGAAGVGEGMCRFGPGAGAQGITAGYSVSLPIFADSLCKKLAKDAALVRKVGMIATIAGNEAAVQYLAAKDPEVNAAVTLARRPAN